MMPCEANSVKDVEEHAGSQGSGWVLPGEPAPQETAARPCLEIRGPFVAGWLLESAAPPEGCSMKAS